MKRPPAAMLTALLTAMLAAAPLGAAAAQESLAEYLDLIPAEHLAEYLHFIATTAFIMCLLPAVTNAFLARSRFLSGTRISGAVGWFLLGLVFSWVSTVVAICLLDTRMNARK